MRRIIVLIAIICLTFISSASAFDAHKQEDKECHCMPCPSLLHLYSRTSTAIINLDTETAVFRNVAVELNGETIVFDVLEFDVIGGSLIPRP